MRRALIAFGAVLCLGLSGRASNGLAVREEAYRQNNVGLGLLEQYQYADAADAFRGALRTDPNLAIARLNLAVALFNVPDLEAAKREARAAAELLPNLPHPAYLLGLIAKTQNRFDEAVAAFERVLALDPTDVGANVNLGQIHLQRKAYAEAVARFRMALAAQPFNGTAAYNLGLALNRSGDLGEGQRMLDRFEELRRTGYGTLLGLSYPEQGRYAEGLAASGDEPDVVDAATPPVRYVDVTAAILPDDQRRPPKGVEADGQVTLFDLDGDGDLDLIEVGREGQRLLRSAGGRFSDITREVGLDPAAGGLGAVAGDYDNDGWPDLLVLRDAGPRLYHNDQGRVFSDVTSLAGIKPGPASASAAFVDVDHDGNLDIFVAGSGAANRLLRNEGGGNFSDVTAEARLAGGGAHAIGIVPTDFDNGRDLDFFVVHADAPPALFKNTRDGGFRDVAGEAGLAATVEGRLACVAAADVDKDGYTDFFIGRADGPDVLLMSDGGRRFTTTLGPAGSSGSTTALFVDYDNDGVLDVVTVARGRLRVLRNIGRGRWAEVSEAAGLPTQLTGATMAAGDLDGDGAEDLILRLPSGALRLLKNEGGSRNRSIRVRLAGRTSNKNGVGAMVDIRCGSLRQRLETSAATPAPAPADVVFGLGWRTAPDAVRVVWPSGIVQTETDESKVDMRTTRFEELDRKPS